MKALRLLKLADFLEHANIPGKFSLSEWKYKTDCGTTGCAIGWACSIPEFRKDGLKLQKTKKDEPGWFQEDNHEADYFPVFNSLEGTNAVEAFFDIGYTDMRNLFFPEGYEKGKRSRKDVARKIRAFVASAAERNASSPY